MRNGSYIHVSSLITVVKNLSKKTNSHKKVCIVKKSQKKIKILKNAINLIIDDLDIYHHVYNTNHYYDLWSSYSHQITILPSLHRKNG